MLSRTRVEDLTGADVHRGPIEEPAGPLATGLPRSVLLAVSEFALRQLGLPGALTGCAYLAGRWGVRLRTGSRRPPATHIASDPERS